MQIYIANGNVKLRQAENFFFFCTKFVLGHAVKRDRHVHTQKQALQINSNPEIKRGLEKKNGEASKVAAKGL